MSTTHHAHTSTSAVALDDDGNPNAIVFPDDGLEWRLVAAVPVERGYPHHTTVVIWYWERTWAHG